MDSVEVAVRITEAVMAKANVARNIKSEELAENYVKLFTDVLKRVNLVMIPAAAAAVPPPPVRPRATSDIFPLSKD